MTDTIETSTRVVSFYCDPEFVDALCEFAIVERCSVSDAAHDIVKRELQYLGYIEIPAPRVATDSHTTNS
jgi:hypothetical protein